MDSETIYTIIGLLIFVGIATKILRSDVRSSVNTKDNTRDDIIDGYKLELYDALLPLKNDKEARKSKKTELLKRISDELSRNIFFEQIEVREIILDLAENS